MSKFSKAQSVTVIIVAMAMGLWSARGAAGGRPYLKVVGPPPLRFELAAVNNAGVLALLTLPKQRESSITNMPPPKPESARAETYTSGAMMPPVISNGGFPFGMISYGMLPWEALSLGTSGVPAGAAGVSTNAASNLLSVTPQMINDYFKPNPTEPPSAPPSEFQPGQTIFVPQELGFVPPISPQSQSVYKSK